MMVREQRGLALVMLLLVAPLWANAQSAPEVFATAVRPQLPAQVRTVGDAAAYYLTPIGYRYVPATPRTGDARALAARIAPRPSAAAAPMRIDRALLALVPPEVRLVIDAEARAVAFEVAP